MNDTQATPDSCETGTPFIWPEELTAILQDVARRRSLRQHRIVSPAEVALEWLLLGKAHAEPEPDLFPDQPKAS